MSLPPDHTDRMSRVRLCLDGLSVGDALGASIFTGDPNSLLPTSPVPAGPWYYTDDTVMALGVAELLDRGGRIEQDELVHVFARRYWANPNRGYGLNVHSIFKAVRDGMPWRDAALLPAD